MNINNSYDTSAAQIVGRYEAEKYAFKQLYLAQMKYGCYDNTEVNIALEKTHTLKSKFVRSHWLITINAMESADIKTFVSLVAKLTVLKWISIEYLYVFELGEANNGLHCHMLVRNNHNKKKESLSQIHSRLFSVIKDKNCIDIRSVWNNDISNVVDYMNKKGKTIELEKNCRFREANNISHQYSNKFWYQGTD